MTVIDKRFNLLNFDDDVVSLRFIIKCFRNIRNHYKLDWTKCF